MLTLETEEVIEGEEEDRKLRWRNNIVKRDFERAEMNRREWERMTEGHDGWRRLVERVKQTR